MGSLRFREEMAGFVGHRERDFNRGLATGRAAGTELRFALEMHVDDVAGFVADPVHLATAHGSVRSPLLGGEQPVEQGWFNLFVSREDGASSRMRYRLWLRDAAGSPVTLSGFKVIHDDPGFDVWSDTTQLRVRLLRGHLDQSAEAAAPPGDVLAAGVVSISRTGFLRLLTTMRAAPRDLAAFGRLFCGELWKVYGGCAGPGQDAFPDPTPETLDDEPAEWERLRRRGLHPELVRFTAGDGFPLNLHHFRGDADPSRGPVLLAAGTGVRANIFSGAPQGETLVDRLVAEGYDVWVENWRASIDFPAHQYTLDEAAVFDHPAAVRTVLEHSGAETLKAVVHCQGSTGFTMSALAGLVPQVTTVVSNGVSLHPVVTRLSRVKLSGMLPVAGLVLDGVDPQWAIRAPTPARAALAAWVRLVRNECREEACMMSSYIYGVGPDILWRHENLDEETHHWVTREFGYVPFSFFRQIARSVRAGHLVAAGELARLPRAFGELPPPEGQTWTFIAGARNRCFLPEGQRRTWEWFERHQPGRHQLVELDRYSHLDVFFGRRAAEETFPAIVHALER